MKDPRDCFAFTAEDRRRLPAITCPDGTSVEDIRALVEQHHRREVKERKRHIMADNQTLPMLEVETLSGTLIRGYEAPPKRAVCAFRGLVSCVYVDSKVRPWREGTGPCWEVMDRRGVLVPPQSDKERLGRVSLAGAMVWERVLAADGMAAALEAVRDFGPWWADAYGGDR